MTHEAQERQILLRQKIREADNAGIRNMLDQGAAIGPTEVEMILQSTSDDQRKSVQALREEILEAKEKLEMAKKTISLEPNHPDNPRPIFNTLTKTFRALGEIL